MTNEQQAIYLRSVLAQLSAALDDARLRMPAEAERESVRVYKGTRDAFDRYFDQENWVTEPAGEFSALMPLVELLERLDEDIALLLPPREP